MNDRRLPWLVYGALGLAVMLPLLLPGFILTLDMVFVPHPPLADISRSSFPFHALLHWLSFVVPADILQKIMLFAILLFSGIGAHRLVQYLAPKTDQLWIWGSYFAGALYMINPFVYSRFMAGQYAVLLGYALLPFFASALLKFVGDPRPRNAVWVAGWGFLIGIVSVHTLGLILVLAAVAAGAALWRYRKDTTKLRAIGLGLLIAAGLWLASNVYWLAPLALGQGNTAAAVAQFDQTDRHAFATLGDSVVGQLGNIIRLQGFWAEDTGMYSLPQEKVPLWGVLALGLFVLVAFGGSVMARQRPFVVAVFGVSGLLAIVMATGALGDLLSNVIPFFAGYREPQKFVALLALVFAVFGAAGFVALLHKIRHPALLHALIIGGLIVPIALTPLMLWGFGGQLAPRQYPEDWYSANEQLRQDTQGAVLFLPWHRYMAFGFSGRIIENPAVNFFEAPILVNSDPEFRGVKPIINDERERQISELLKTSATPQFAGELAALDVKYVLLAKEYDFIDFEPYVNQPGLEVVADTDNLTLYRNQKWKEDAPWSQ